VGLQTAVGQIREDGNHILLSDVTPFGLSTSDIGPPIEASSIDWTQQSRFHLMTTEEPSLETLWLQNIRTIDKVQITDRSNTSSSSNTFRDELRYIISHYMTL
jgi:hypothetical protein